MTNSVQWGRGDTLATALAVVIVIAVIGAGMYANDKYLDQNMIIESLRRDQAVELTPELGKLDDRLDAVACGTDCQIERCQADPGCAERLALSLPDGFHVVKKRNEDSYILTAVPNPDSFQIVSDLHLSRMQATLKRNKIQDFKDQLNHATGELEVLNPRPKPKPKPRPVKPKSKVDALALHANKVGVEAGSLDAVQNSLILHELRKKGAK